MHFCTNLWNRFRNYVNQKPKSTLATISECNKTYQRQLTPEKSIRVVSQVQSDTDKICQPKEVIRTAFQSRKEIEHTAKTSALIISSGNFTESGISGLEFLLNGYPTFVLENSDIGNILHKVSPILAQAFCLKHGDGITPIHKLSHHRQDENIFDGY